MSRNNKDREGPTEDEKQSSKFKDWDTLNTREIYKTTFFRFRTEELRLPDQRVMPNYYILEFSDWVNIVALTKENQVVLIRQYRPPVKGVTLEIPGGSVDPRLAESPQQAAVRELFEETGYEPSEVRLLGHHFPNPALQSNKLWTYLALGCEKKGDQKLDEFEDIEVMTASVGQTLEFARSGMINHSLVLTALHLAAPFFEKLS